MSKNTIEAAYEQLLAEGYIESISRKGYFVCKFEQMMDVEGSETEVEEIPFREGTIHSISPKQGLIRMPINLRIFTTPK